MISFAVVEISLLFRCVPISDKQAGSVFLWSGWSAVGWLRKWSSVFSRFQHYRFLYRHFHFLGEPGLCRPVGKHADTSGFVLLDLLEHSCYNTKGRKGIEL